MNTLLIFAGLLFAAMLIEPLARRLRLPFSAALVAAGFAGSELLVAFGVDTGLRWDFFSDLVARMLLPVLVFEAAFRLDARDLLADLIPMLYLAMPLLLVATFVTAAILYFGIGHTGFPWSVALLTGALLSPTDPVGITSVCRRLGLGARLPTLIEGESLFNDATAIVLFALLLTIATMTGETPGLAVTVLEFIRVFIGGAAAGVAVGALGVLMMRLLQPAVPRALVILGGALFSVHLAGDVLHVSGVMAALSAGLLLGAANRRLGGEFCETLWRLNAYIASALIFLLVGATITVDMFVHNWLAMLIGIAAVLIARALIVYLLLPAVHWAPGVAPLPIRLRTALYWGGLRGAATVALALSLPLELEAWWTVQSIAYGVVLFALFVQAPSLALAFGRVAPEAGACPIHPVSAR